MKCCQVKTIFGKVGPISDPETTSPQLLLYSLLWLPVGLLQKDQKVLWCKPEHTWLSKGKDSSIRTQYFKQLSIYLHTNMKANKPRYLRGTLTVDTWVNDASPRSLGLGKNCGTASKGHPLPATLSHSPVWSGGLPVTEPVMSPLLLETKLRWENKSPHLNCFDLICFWDFHFVTSGCSPSLNLDH